MKILLQIVNHVMIINTQAFNARGKDARRIYQELDQFGTRKPIDIISQTNPVLIIDEPQSVEGIKHLRVCRALIRYLHYATLLLTRLNTTKFTV